MWVYLYRCLWWFPCWVLCIYWCTARFSLLGLVVYIGCLPGFVCLLDCWVFFSSGFCCVYLLNFVSVFHVFNVTGFVYIIGVLGFWLTGFSVFL